MISLKRHRFPKEIILMMVRWYCAYSLSYKDVEEMAKERGIKIDHSSVQRWVVKFAAQLEEVFRKRYKRATQGSWRMDETYLKHKGQPIYLYRAVDKQGDTIDFFVSEKRDKKAALEFFCKAIGQHGLPELVTMDKSGANKAAIDRINLVLAILFLLIGFFCQIVVRQVKYLNNRVEQDHRGIKRITRPMMGFKSMAGARATIAGIELHRMLRKGQHIHSQTTSIFQQFYSLAA
jgi:putative transposase